MSKIQNDGVNRDEHPEIAEESGDSSADTPFAAQNQSGLTIESPQSTRNSPEEITRRSKAALQKRKDELDRFLAAPRDTQRKLVEDKWAQLCYELVGKAQKYALNVTDKDFGKLSQIIIAAATAKDKVFHREDAQTKQGNVVFNLFGNVGLDAIKKMLQPPTPKVVNAKEIVHEESVARN